MDKAKIDIFQSANGSMRYLAIFEMDMEPGKSSPDK